MSVIVAGSLNLDSVVTLDRFPNPGETVPGKEINLYPGGKGLNQAVAVSRSGSRVGMLGSLGNDAAANMLESVLQDEQIDSQFISRIDIASGCAYIEVDQTGNNRIVVVPGANGKFKFDSEVFSDLTNKISAKVLLAQLEVPISELINLFIFAKGCGLFTILNPAPAEDFDFKILEFVDLLVPNQHEAAQLTNMKVENFDHAIVSSKKLVEQGANAVLTTLGELGSIYFANGNAKKFQSYKVKSVDSTSAGDAFCGALAGQISQGAPIDLAIRFASAAGALATTKPGAVPSLPKQSNIENLISTGELI